MLGFIEPSQSSELIFFVSQDQVLAIHGRLLLDDALGRRVLVSTFCRYRVSLQRKKCCQQIIGLNDESFSSASRIDAKEKSVLGKMLCDASERIPLFL